MLFGLLKDAQLACKRRPLSPLLTHFWSLIKHLLYFSFITNWFPVSCGYASCICFCRCLQMFFLKLCNIFFKPLPAVSRSLKMKRFLIKGDDNRVDSWLSLPCFCLMSNFCSFVKVIRKASKHLDGRTIYSSKSSNVGKGKTCFRCINK